MLDASTHGALLATLVSSVTLSSPTGAQEPRLLLAAGARAGDAGEVLAFQQMVVNDSGSFYLDAPILRRGDFLDAVFQGRRLFLLEGAPVPAPRGATLAGAGSMSMNNAGSVAIALRLDGTTAGKEDDDLMTWNALPVAQEGSLPISSNVAGVAFTAGTTYGQFDAAWLDDRDALLVLGTLDDPGFKGKETFASILQTDGAGQVVDERFLAVRRYPLPSTGETVDAVVVRRDGWAFNEQRDWIGQMTLAGSLAVVKNGAVVARAGTESPAHPGRNLLTFTSLGMNNRGDFAVSVLLDGSKLDDTAIVLNTTDVVVTKGDTFSDIEPYQILHFDAAPVRIADDGAVFWYAQTTGPAAASRAYFRSVRDGVGAWTHRVLVQEGVTTIGDQTIESVTSLSAFEVSDSGQYWLGTVRLDGRDALLSIDFGDTSVR